VKRRGSGSIGRVKMSEGQFSCQRPALLHRCPQ